MTKRKIEYRVIPPEADGKFVAHMEEVLETYEKASDLLICDQSSSPGASLMHRRG
jgi:hypothetical protein